MKRLTLSISFLIVNLWLASAQDVPTGEIEDAQIIIEKDKPLTLPRATRLYEKTEVLPVSDDQVEVDYDLSQPSYSFEAYRFDLPKKEYNGVSKREHYDNYIKAGFGNYVSPLVQGYFSKADENNKMGLYINHESFGKGPVRGKGSAYGHSEALFQGSFKAGELLFKPSVNYEREAFYFYGYDQPAVELVSKTTPFISNKINGNYFAFAPKITSGPKSKLNYYFNPDISYTSMNVAGSSAFNQESNFNIAAGSDFEIKKNLRADVGLGYQYLAYKSGISQNRSILKVAPGVLFDKNDLKLRVGADLAVSSDSAGSGSSVNVYPNIESNYKINQELAFYGKIKGGMIAQSLYKTRQSCRYLEDSLTLNNQNNKVSLDFGLSYQFIPKVVIEPFIRYSMTSNKALVGVSANDSSRFVLLYDGGNFQQTDFGASVTYATERSVLTARLMYSSYSTDKLSQAWYLPATQVKINYSQKLTESLNITSYMIVMDGIQAMQPVSAGVTQLNTIVDFGLGATYEINKAFSAFVDGQNLFNQNYQRYLNYPSRGLSAKLGFIYRF